MTTDHSRRWFNKKHFVSNDDYGISSWLAMPLTMDTDMLKQDKDLIKAAIDKAIANIRKNGEASNGKMTRIQEIIEEEQYLHLACRDCGRMREIPADTFPAPRETPVPEVRRYAKCSNCGSKRIYSTGQIHITPLPKSLQFDGRET